jgi:hypothetical protein
MAELDGAGSDLDRWLEPLRQGRAPARFDRFYHTDY